jgi:hypothetical protein
MGGKCVSDAAGGGSKRTSSSTIVRRLYLIATAFGGEAIPPRVYSGTETTMHS